MRMYRFVRRFRLLFILAAVTVTGLLFVSTISGSDETAKVDPKHDARGQGQKFIKKPKDEEKSVEVFEDEELQVFGRLNIESQQEYANEEGDTFNMHPAVNKKEVPKMNVDQKKSGSHDDGNLQKLETQLKPKKVSEVQQKFLENDKINNVQKTSEAKVQKSTKPLGKSITRTSNKEEKIPQMRKDSLNDGKLNAIDISRQHTPDSAIKIQVVEKTSNKTYVSSKVRNDKHVYPNKTKPIVANKSKQVKNIKTKPKKLSKSTALPVNGAVQKTSKPKTKKLASKSGKIGKTAKRPRIRYEPTWNSIDKRPTPAWFDEAKLGIFIHWGVFSVPSYINEWFWWEWKGPTPEKAAVDFMQKNYPPDFTYPDFGKMFTTEFFNPDEWAELFQDSGAKYIVLTSKHHEGFTNWPSPVSWNWNSMDLGPHRDLVGDLATAIRNKTDLRFGLYHSLFEWFNQLYVNDKAANFTTTSFVSGKTMPELYEIVKRYHPDIIWSDGDFAPDTYWNSTEFLAWLFNDSPVRDYVATNDRWGTGIRCHHGGYYSCSDKYNPGVLQDHKWENCMTIDRHSWGFRRDAKITDYLTIEELISTLASTISCGGNMLMNIGPAKDGTIAPIFQERLRQMGSWLKVNGEAVYSSKAWRSQKDSTTQGIWYTKNNGAVYAFVLSWPKDNNLNLGSPIGNRNATVQMLGLEGKSLEWEHLSLENPNGIKVIFPQIPPDQLPCKWAWVLKLVGFE